MSTTNDGGLAFPGFAYTEGHGPMRRDANNNWEVHEPGMTLRDYFAAAALFGCLERMAEMQGLGSDTFPANCATHAYRIADAMLAARERQ